MKLPVVALLPMVLFSAANPQQHTFVTGEHVVTMDIRFLEPYVGKRLVFHSTADPTAEICAVGNGEPGACPERFVGAVAIVTYTLKRINGKAAEAVSIRELVTVIAQSPDLRPRAPFELIQPILRGIISDVQVFGYEESDIAEALRVAARKESQERSWRICRQELYLNHAMEPFAIIDWRHTVSRIEIVQVRAGKATKRRR
jgi:hypothetical protein